MIGVFVGFSRIFLLGILIFKGLTALRVYKSFGVKGLRHTNHEGMEHLFITLMFSERFIILHLKCIWIMTFLYCVCH
jgi:hypothetical protein